MKAVLLIGSGGFIGSILRYLTSLVVQNKVLSTFPFGTLVVNITGCLIIGVIFAFSERGLMNPDWRMFLATGICGGFTTFSAFSNETMGLIRDGQALYAFGYISASVVLGLLATFLGISLIKLF